MAIAQGINKKVSFKAQTALGTPATGTGGQELRRVTSVSNQARATYVNNEIVGHQQSTGVNLGTASTTNALDGLLSPGTYSKLMEALLRKVFVATTPIAASVTIAGTSPNYTVTDAANSFLVAGVKIGDVIRLTGAGLNTANVNNNLLLTGVTATVLTGVLVSLPANGGTAMVAEGPIATSTVTVVGKKSHPPLTGHTDTLFTFEEWYSDLGLSETYPDTRIGQCDVGLPASGNATVKFANQGLGVRTLGSTQSLTTVAIADIAGGFTCAAATLYVGKLVTISGTLGGTGSITGYASPTTYKISATNGSTTFTLTTTADVAIVTTIGTPTGLTYTVNQQVLTNPTAATTAPVLTAVRGVLVVNGAQTTNVTGITLTINPTLTAMGPIVGSNFAPDMSRGKIMVTGSFTALFDSNTLVNLYNAETKVGLTAVMAADTTKNSDFMAFTMSAIKLTGDAPNDGELGIVRTYPFTAELNALGGAALANDQTVISVQDSLA